MSGPSIGYGLFYNPARVVQTGYIKQFKTELGMSELKLQVSLFQSSSQESRSFFPSFQIYKIKITQLQKRCANDGFTECINIPFWPCWLIGVGGERRWEHKFFSAQGFTSTQVTWNDSVSCMCQKWHQEKLFPTHSSSWLVLSPGPSANSIDFSFKAHHFC